MKNIEKIKKEAKEELLYIFFSVLLFSNFIWIMMSPAANYTIHEYLILLMSTVLFVMFVYYDITEEPTVNEVDCFDNYENEIQGRCYK